MRYLIIIVIIFIYMSCGVKPSSSPGNCSLDCSNAIIAPNTFSIKKISADETWYCGGAGEFAKPVKLKYLVYSKDKLDETKTYPKPAISVDINVGGGLSSNPDKIPQENFPNYIGIGTPKSKFCSDSCGVVTFDIYPLCYDSTTNLISIQLFSGSVSSETYSMTINPPDTSKE